MTKILILEDDDFIRQQLAGILQEKGYSVVEAASVGQFNKIYEQEESEIDVFLLDVYLPDGNGFDVCRKIREHGSQIIIFLTSCDDEDSIIKGLDCGGDDYVVKPFRVAELVSRIMANVRRISGGTDIYKDGTLTVDFKNKSIMHADKQISVSPTEFHVLEILINNKGLIVRRDTFFQKMWDRYGTFVEDNTLTVTVSRLKTKLGNRDDGRAYIETIRGIGYRWKNI